MSAVTPPPFSITSAILSQVDLRLRRDRSAKRSVERRPRPPAGRVPGLMADLLGWLRDSEEHPLIAGSVFHYEFEFIHPFEDGNGRLGRLWQTLILTRWKPLFAHVPVESVVRARQSQYYEAIELSSADGESTRFIAFMLDAILAAVEQELHRWHSRR